MGHFIFTGSWDSIEFHTSTTTRDEQFSVPSPVPWVLLGSSKILDFGSTVATFPVLFVSSNTTPVTVSLIGAT